MWKFSSKWVNDLYIGLKTMKLLEENKRGKLHDLEFRNDTKSMSNKRKKLGFIKKNFLCIREHQQESEKTTHKWEDVYKSYIWPESNTYKDLLQLSNTEDSFKKRTDKGLE